MNNAIGHDARIASPPAVVIVGAGSAGLLLAVELRRRDVDVLVVDPRPAPAPATGSVVVLPRTMEILAAASLDREVLGAGRAPLGWLTYHDGRVQPAASPTPPNSSYDVIALPQEEMQRILIERLALLGTRVRWGSEVTRAAANSDDVSVWLRLQERETCVQARYLVGCDGNSDVVRRSVDIGWAGNQDDTTYLVADVHIDWSLPDGHVVRCLTGGSERGDESMDCIPLPGAHRYWIAARARVDVTDVRNLSVDRPASRHLRDVQQVVDRLSPRPAWVHSMRWSSLLRAGSGVATRFAAGRVLLVGDAAHSAPPVDADGLNRGLQDAANLGWKLAMVLIGSATPTLLDSYDAERRPSASGGVVGMKRPGGLPAGVLAADTVARYPDSALSTHDVGPGLLSGGPAAGEVAPDATGLQQFGLAAALRWHEMLRHPRHTLLLWASSTSAAADAGVLCRQLETLAPGFARSYIVAPPSAAVNASGRALIDRYGALAATYGFEGGPVQGYLIRPDGYVGYRSAHVTIDELATHLAAAYGVCWG